MSSVPFGIARLDSIIGGGSPPGSVVLLAGESGAGAREFLYTSAAMSALARTDTDLFDLYYGEVADGARVSSEVHYLSFTADPGDIIREMRYTMAEEIVESAADGITFRDLSPEFFQLSPLPREWYEDQTTSLAELGQRDRPDDVLTALGEYLTAHATESLICIDSVTDLVSSVSDDLAWSDITMVMRGLKKAAYHWGGLILVLVNEDALTDREFGTLMDAASGTFRFTWESGGSQRARTMVVREFRGVLARIEEEDIVRFETEIHDGGFDISDVRKIR
ncbi:RAD55 family ATPase [Halorubrum vacuolatum]|uniref:RecA-superfamily ATPase, KaiC/GvpD/RAD55 family n=1 Tax=Halorubrum vacuolatum TaxID=63740 RepID=A0A238XMK5_HALVU|nr:HTR-like protein [Halorubrum vacuolatum]SNR60167.1 RecA-superfamily ATPase, KaiC/GvpD/RAD55 family [Halorubrum vacuolatum]